MKKQYLFVLLLAVFALGALLRFYNLNWDAGFHMHPDERAILLSVVELSPPTSLKEFFSADSPWNPKFFAYGSLPFYLLYFTGHMVGSFSNPAFAHYEGMNLVGRYLSAFFDLGTMFFLFLIGKRLFTKIWALVPVFLYAVSTLPIQLSHFYAVDTLLTFFITGTLYLLLSYRKRPSGKRALLIGFFFGSALATKMSATTLLLPIGLAFFFTYFEALLKHPAKWGKMLVAFLESRILHFFLFTGGTIFTFFVFQPYAFFDFTTFSHHTMEQSQLTRDPFAFPYTLQYVGKIPYVYELKNILFYGLGPLLTFFSLSGLVLMTIRLIPKKKVTLLGDEIILLTFFWVYFLIVGNFSVGFMRYMLPLYPILAITAACFIQQTLTLFPLLKRPSVMFLCGITLCLLLLIWPVSFLHVYTRQNTRVQATNWIIQFIPPGKTLAIEHWDDALPLLGQQNYHMETLPLYDLDTPEKWQQIREQLGRTDYIILASNRLYTPLMKLTNCRALPNGRCYTDTAMYYQQLFNGALGFSLVADITSYPTIPFTHLQLPDQAADESFTVYDHPRVLIFKKN